MDDVVKVKEGTYTGDLTKKLMAIFDCDYAFAVAEVVDGSCHEDDVSYDRQSNQSRE